MSPRTVSLAQTTIGKKAVMAVSGVVLLGFVFFHMLGNLAVFAAPTVVPGQAPVYALDTYAALLRTVPMALWAARAVLLLAVVAHAWAAFSLIQLNRAARPVAYHAKRDLATSYAAKTMRIGGPLLLLFIVYHLLHYTFGVVGAGFDANSVHASVVGGFSNPVVTGVYVAAMLLLGLHLYHGTWSMLQTLGLSHPRYDRWRTRFAAAFAVVVAGGNIGIAVGVLAGFVGGQGV